MPSPNVAWQRCSSPLPPSPLQSAPGGFDDPSCPRRGRKAIVTQFNTSGWEGHKALLESDSFATHIVCGQEHKVAEIGLAGARSTLKRLGWDASVAPAVDTGSLTDTRFRSAGTYVAIRGHIGSQLVWPCNRPDLSPSDAPGRLAGRWANVLGGLLVFSMYFRDGVGWNHENRSFVRQLGSVVCGLTLT